MWYQHCARPLMVALASLGCVFLAATAGAQGQPGAAAVAGTSYATLLSGSEMSRLLSVWVPRDKEDIERLLEGMRAMERSAADEIERTRRLALDAEGGVRIIKEEIQTTKVRLDVAKKAGDKGGQAAAEVDAKRQNGEREFLEKLRDALRADADRLEAEREAATARAKALELELQVAQRSEEMGTVTPTAEAVAEHRYLVRRMLVAYKESSERWKDASEKRKRVAERRLKQLESLSKLNATAR